MDETRTFVLQIHTSGPILSEQSTPGLLIAMLLGLLAVVLVWLVMAAHSYARDRRETEDPFQGGRA